MIAAAFVLTALSGLLVVALIFLCCPEAGEQRRPFPSRLTSPGILATFAVSLSFSVYISLSSGAVGPSDILLCVGYQLFVSSLITVFYTDIKKMIVPDSALLIALCAALTLYTSRFFTDGAQAGRAALAEGLLGLAAGGGFFLFFYVVSRLITGRECLGFGDVKLMAVCGFCSGWQCAIAEILISSVTASVLLTVLSLLDRKASDARREYPFAPFICLSAALVFLPGRQLVLDLFALLL